MGVFSKIKNWISNTFGGGGGSSSRSTSRASRVSNYGGGGSRSYRDYSGGGYQSDYQSYQRRRELERKERKKKQDKATQALASISKRTDALSSGRSATTAGGATSTGNGQQRVLAKLNERSKSTPPDPKQKAAQESRERTTATLKKISEDRKSYDKATGNKYNVDKNGLKARQAQKSQAYDVNAEKWETKQHPVATSFARGATSGVTFGGSELLAQTSKQRKKSGAEEYYQKNKNRFAEGAGEIVGSLAGFGLTGEASARAVGKLAPKALKSGSQKAATKLASKKLIQRAAEQEAIKRFGAEGATKEVIQQIAKRRAGQVVSELGKDAAINVTTGLASDLSRSYLDARDANGRIDPEKFGRSMAMSAGLNTVLGGATSLVPAFRVGRNFADDAIEGAVRNADDVARAVEPPRTLDDNVRVSLNRRRRTDVVMPEVRPQTTEEIAEQAAREVGIGNADNVAREIEPPPIREADAKVTPPMDEQAIKEEAAKAVGEDFENAKADALAEFDAHQAETGLTTKERRRAERNAEAIQMALDQDAKKAERNAAKEAKAAKAKREDVNNFAAIDDASDMGFEKGGDDIANAKAKVETEVNNTPPSKSAFDKKKDAAYKEMSGTDLNTDNVEKWSGKEQKELIDKNYRTTEEHTRRGYTTIAVTGDKGFKGIAHKAIENGETVVDVYHDKENLARGAYRVMQKADKEGGVQQMIKDFTEYADGKRKLSSNEVRDQLYDVIAAVDFANANKDQEWAGDLFLAACKAGAEQTSVSGLSLRMWKEMAMSSPEHRAKAVRQQILEMFNKSKGFRKEAGKLGKGNKISMSELDDMLKKNPVLRKTLDELDKMGAATSVDEVEEIASRALLQARRAMPMTAFDQLTQWRYVAMLSSPKTHVRNITSNVYSATLGQLRDGMASGIEDGLIKSGKLDAALKKQGLEKADYYKSVGGMSGKAWKDSHVGLASGTELNSLKSKLHQTQMELDSLAATDTTKIANLKKRIGDLEAEVKSKQASYDKLVGGIKRPTAKKAQEAWISQGYEKLVANAEKFEKKVYNDGISKGAFKINDKLSKFIGNALETSDAISLERIFRERYDKILTANGWEALQKTAKGTGKEAKAAAARLKKLEEYAAQEASYIAATDTYRNYNSLSQAMSKYVSDSLFNYDAPMYKKILGGALHATMPFTKVPVNLVKRGIDYSPVGLLLSKKSLNNAISTGNITEINRACERLAEGRIGTGIAALGAGLGFIDPDGMRINTRLDKNDTLDKRKRDAGYQDYSIQAAGRNITMEWLTPTSSTLFTGVEFGRLVRKMVDTLANDNGMTLDVAELTDIPINLASSLLEPSLQLSVFQGINNSLEDVVESDNYSKTNANPWLKLGTNVFGDYAKSMMPTVIGQISRSMSPYDYFVTGDTDAIYGFNSTMSRIPVVSKAMFGAKTNSWGQIKNEKQGGADYAKAAAKNLLSPANVNKTTWDETDEKMMDLSKTLGDDIFPKNNYDKEMTFGKNAGDMQIKMSNKELAEYNVQRGKSGRDAMADALENVMFNRWDKDDTGHYTIPHDDNITDAEREKLLKQYDGKGIKEVVAWVIETPNFKSATPAEQRQILGQIYGDTGSDDDESRGAKRSAERYIAGKHGISSDEYDYYNEVPRSAQEALAPLIADGLITYKQALDFKRGAGKTYYRTDKRGEKGGTVQTYYNKKEMLEYLQQQGYSEEEAAALFNAFKLPQTKEYGSSSYRRGRRRRGRRRGYRRYGGGGGSTAKATVPKPKTLKASSFTKGVALGSQKSKSSSSGKAEPPMLKRVEAKIDLPNKKR